MRPDSPTPLNVARKAVIADENVDDLFADVGRQVGEGLHKEYLRVRVGDELPRRQAKLEFYGIVSSNGTIRRLSAAADALRINWTARHKAAFAAMDEKYREMFREIEAAGPNPEVVTIDIPASVESKMATTKWKNHLYVDSDGLFPRGFRKVELGTQDR